MRRRVVAILGAVVVSVVCVSSVLGTQAAGGLPMKTTAPMSAAQPEYVPGELLVKFRDSTPTKSIRGVHATLGAKVAKHFSFIGVDHVILPEGMKVTEAVATYKTLPNVEYAEPNYYRYAQSLPPDPVIPADPRFSDQWGLHNTGQTIQGTVGTVDADVDAPEAWRYPSSGQEVIVAVLDSGVGWFHPDLGAELIWQNPNEIWGNANDDDGNGKEDDTYGWDFVDNDEEPLSLQNEHGSHVAGIVGALQNNLLGIAGTCPGVKILPVRILNEVGVLTIDRGVDALEYVKDLRDRGHPIWVVNTSYGAPTRSTPERNAIAALGDSGILVCASAGNSGVDNDADPFNSNYPSSYDLDNIIAVAASDSGDQLAWGSHWGATSVDVAAPGVDILSTVLYRLEMIQTFDAPFDWIQVGWPLLWGTEPIWGNKALSDSLGTVYFNNSNTMAYRVFPLDISDTIGIKVDFDAMFNLDPDVDPFGFPYDYVTLELSDGGPFAPTQIYYRSPWTGGPFSCMWGWSVWWSLGLMDHFESEFIPNFGASELYAGFRLVSDSVFVSDGIYIDNFRVRVFPAGGAFDGTEVDFMGGTSMASPMVAGAAAFLKMVEPGLDYTQIKALLLDNVDPMTMPLGKATVTNGRLNLHNAVRMIDYDEDGMILEDEHNHDCDPHDADSDDDYLNDGDELDRGTDPTDEDTDDDGLGDGEEVFRGTNPLDPDSDDDGYLDGVEVEYGSDPNDANDVPACTLTVASSNPNSGVSITVSPADNNGHGNGTTQFTRTYDMGTSVVLTAPATADGNDFAKWQRNGSDYSAALQVGVTMNTNYTMTAVYSQGTYTVYAPWYYESLSDGVADGGGLADGTFAFVCVRNASDEANTLQITYLNRVGDTEGPYEVVVAPGEAVAWSPYSDAGGTEMAGPPPNASFGAGSVKIEATHPVVGRIMQLAVQEGAFVSMATQPLVEECQLLNDASRYEVYAPWYYESLSDGVADGGGLADGTFAFVCVRNASDEANTLQITYLNRVGDTEGPYEVVVSAGEAVAWSPYSDAGGAEMAGPPANASFGAGSVKIESTQPVVGRIMQVAVQEGAFVSMATQPLVEECQLLNDASRYEVYAPWYYESVSDGVADGGGLADGTFAFVCVRNASDEANTLQITYLNRVGDTEGPYEVVVSAGEAVAWSPYSDAGGAEMAGPPANASFGAGSVKIESTQPVVGRIMQVAVQEGTFVSMATQPLVEECQLLNDASRYEVYAPWYYESVSDGVADGGGLADGTFAFVCVRNASDEANTLQITYLNRVGDTEGPYEVVVSAGEAVAWSPYSDAGGAEMAGPPANATFGAGSVKIESTQPVVGRIMQVAVQEGTFVSMATQPLVEETSSSSE